MKLSVFLVSHFLCFLFHIFYKAVIIVLSI